ncbi:hypothetical protein [Microcoleus sp. PH2017_22_RUC_O_B]|nr:hypothetical protein [Microcoleus sp. PH2017_22_RUC_O_B]
MALLILPRVAQISTRLQADEVEQQQRSFSLIPIAPYTKLAGS